MQLFAWLPRHYPDRFACHGSCITNLATGEEWDTQNSQLHPLMVASLLVQVEEGMCVFVFVCVCVCEGCGRMW